MSQDQSPDQPQGPSADGDRPHTDPSSTQPIPAQQPTYGQYGAQGQQNQPNQQGQSSPYGQQSQQGQQGQQSPYGQQNQQGQGHGQPGPYGQQSQNRPSPYGQNPYGAPGQSSQQGAFGQPSNGSSNPMTTPPTPSGTTRRRSRGVWFAVPIAAILAAALASVSTYALTNNPNSASGGTGSPSVKINPSDYQNNNAVNWTSVASKVSPSVVSITVRVGNSGDQGSGVVLDKSGDIVTNNHVVAAAKSSGSVQVTLSNNKTYSAKIVGTDPSTDLAVIKITNAPSDLTAMPFGSSKSLVVGQPVMAVGNPLGLSGTVTTGIISALNRPVTTSEAQAGQAADPVVTNAIQTSAAINPGNSGGALVSASGKLIGINSSIATLGQSSQTTQSGNIGIGFAIPVEVVNNITGQLLKSGKAVHAQLGVTAGTAIAKVDGATQAAAQVKSVKSASAASRAGLKVGDFIIDVDGQSVAGSDSLVGFVRARNVGDKVKLTVIRNGNKQDVTVTLGKAPSN
ncbi:MAG: trypsin-like peptidase domain-containing protein [Actinomycetota bacterium]|nr:trypsin-like peptidase domain-containing protein [Actinomycetota bacterium]